MEKAWVLSYPLSTKQRLKSDWMDAQSNMSLCLGQLELSEDLTIAPPAALFVPVKKAKCA